MVVIGRGGRSPLHRTDIVSSAAKRRQVRDGKIDIRTFDWQGRNWDLFDRVSIVSYGLGTLTFNNLSKAQIVPAIQPDDPNQDPEPVTGGVETEIVASLKGPFGGPSEIVATMGTNFQIAGEGYLVGTEGEVDNEWDVVSSEELKKVGRESLLQNADGSVRQKLDDDDFVSRMWRAHPRFRNMPMSPLTATQDDCLEWLLLSRRARGQLRTRMSAGWMFIPSEVRTLGGQQFVDPEGGLPQEVEDWEEPFGANADQDPFLEELIDVMTAPLKDEDDLAGVVPWLLVGPGDQANNIRQQPWRRSDEETADHERRTELAKSIAIGLDWPVEKVLGMGESSYWNAWQIDQSAFEEHLDPLLQLVLSSFTVGWYRPMLLEMGVAPEVVAKSLLWRDLSSFGQLSAWSRATDAFDREAIGLEALRKYGRFSEEDAPDDDELEERREAKKTVEVVESGDEDEAPSDEDPGPAEPSEEEEVAASVGVTAAVGDSTMARLAAIDQGLMSRITTAGDAAVGRALEKAGAKIRSRTSNDKEQFAQIADVPNEEIGQVLGKWYVTEQLQFTDDDLIDEATFDKLEGQVDRWIEDAQKEAHAAVTGLVDSEPVRDLEDEERNRLGATELILGYLVALSLSRLFTPSSDPEQGEVRAGAVSPLPIMEAMSVAGGGGTSAPLPTSYEQGIGNGTTVTGWLEDGGFFVEGFRWVYGDPGARETTFQPHLDLDASEFASWDDPVVANFTTWPSASHFYPQDHGGCLCSFERIVFQA